MCQLIIGNVTENTAKIWVRGTANNHSTTTLTAQITLKSDLRTVIQNLTIYKHNNFIGVFEFDELNPSDSGLIRTLYTVNVVFKDIAGVPLGYNCRGSFNTIPRVNYPVSFILGSNFLNRNEDDGKRVFKNLNNLRKIEKPAFMLHAGNQIYIDAPASNEPIQSDSYVKKYQEALKSREAAEFLGRIANYTAINDHELYFRFANDVEYDYKTASYYLREALPSYQIFQHNRNPHPYGSDKLYYHYNYAGAAFFVMDTRVERFQFVKAGAKRQMISTEQMEAFKQWLLDNAQRAKFVVTSVPFISIKETDYSEYWSAEAFMAQKEEILAFIKANKLSKLVFLTGQGNASLHSTLTLKTGVNEHVVLHELMCGTLNHYQCAISNYEDFIWLQTNRSVEADYVYKIESANAELDSSVMCISVKDDVVSFKSYTTKYMVEEDEVPPIIHEGSFSI